MDDALKKMLLITLELTKDERDQVKYFYSKCYAKALPFHRYIMIHSAIQTRFVDQ